MLSWALDQAPGRTAERAVGEWADRLGIEVELITCAYSLNGSRPLARDVLSAPNRPTALFALSDSIAFGVYVACQELGLRIPEDISVVGFDDHPISRLLAPPLTSLDWNTPAVAATAVRFLLAVLDEEPGERTAVLRGTLRARGSTGPVVGGRRRRLKYPPFRGGISTVRAIGAASRGPGTLRWMRRVPLAQLRAVLATDFAAGARGRRARRRDVDQGRRRPGHRAEHDRARERLPRSQHGLAPLKANNALMRAARAHSRDMVENNYFDHTSQDGEQFSQRLIRFGYHWHERRRGDRRGERPRAARARRPIRP